MNKIDLFKKLRLLYGSNCSLEEINANFDAYNNHMQGNIDFERLYNLITQNWKYCKCMPTPSFILEQVLNATIKDKTTEQTKYEYKCIILKDSDKLKMKEGEIRYGYKDDLINLENSSIKFKVIDKRKI